MVRCRRRQLSQTCAAWVRAVKKVCAVKMVCAVKKMCVVKNVCAVKEAHISHSQKYSLGRPYACVCVCVCVCVFITAGPI
jgi:hypothetical protein